MTTRVLSTRRIQVPLGCLSRPKILSGIRLYHSYDHPSPPGPFSATQSRILSAAISHVPNHGFTLKSLCLGANEAGYIDATTNLFPSGAFSLVHYYLYSRRSTVETYKHLPQNFDLQDKNGIIKALTWERLKGNRDIIHHWPEALALMVLPSNINLAIKELSLLADEILFLSGDTSVDTSWYTKRASLATIYASTELFMTMDKSLDFIDTRKFLERRFDDAQNISSMLGAASQWGSFTANAMVNILRSKGVRI